MLSAKIASELLPRKVAGRLAVTFMSFGFKHGPPRGEDLAFDVRFLPNPHYVPELRELTVAVAHRDADIPSKQG